MIFILRRVAGRAEDRYRGSRSVGRDGTGRDGIGDRLRYYCDNDGPYMHSVRGGMSSINGSAPGHLPSRALNSFTRQASVDPIRTWSSFDGWHVWVAGIGWTRQSSIINATVMPVMVHLAPLQSAASETHGSSDHASLFLLCIYYYVLFSGQTVTIRIGPWLSLLFTLYQTRQGSLNRLHYVPYNGDWLPC